MSPDELLILLPYKPTPWTEQVVEYVLYMLWDMGFKVGHATRSVDECIRLTEDSGNRELRAKALLNRGLIALNQAEAFREEAGLPAKPRRG